MTQGQSSGNIPALFNRAVGIFSAGALTFGVGLGLTLANVLSQQPNAQLSIAATAALAVGGGSATLGGVKLEAVKRSLNAEVSTNQPSGIGQQL